MSREEALKLKAIFYFDPFRKRFGDWLSASKEFHEIEESERTQERKVELLNKYKVSILVDDKFEPILTEEILAFVWGEYHKLYNNLINN